MSLFISKFSDLSEVALDDARNTRGKGAVNLLFSVLISVSSTPMSQSPLPSESRDNRFWAYRDPPAGRWVTLMTSEQCRRLAKQVFMPQSRQDANPLDSGTSET